MSRLSLQRLAVMTAALAAILLVALVMFDAKSARAQIQAGDYATTISALNLRSGPGTGYAVKLVIPCGARPYVSAGPYDSVWYRVTYAGASGYVHGGYITQGSAAAYRCTGTYATTTRTLNLRSGAGKGYSIVRVIPHGGQVYLSDGPYNGIWYKATYRGSAGYVNGEYLTQGRAVVIRHMATSRKVVALTFDAGSDVGYASQILDTLAANGVKATFGVTGRWAEANPALLRRMVEEGHTVMNHTYSHPSFTGYSTGTAPLGYGTRADELRKTESAVQSIAGTSTRPYFRPPYGDYDTPVLVDVYTRGYEYNVMWGTDSLGWQGLTRQQILQRVLDGLEPGEIYLFHVGSQSQDGPALQSVISELRARGYGFVTIDGFYRR